MILGHSDIYKKNEDSQLDNGKSHQKILIGKVLLRLSSQERTVNH